MERFNQFLSPVLRGLLIVIAICLAGWIAYKILNAVLLKYGRKITGKTKTEIDDKFLEFIEKFLSRIFLIITLFFIGRYLATVVGEKFIHYFQEFLFVAVAVITTTVFIKLINLVIDWYLEKTDQKNRTNINQEFGPLLHRLVQIIIFTTGLLVILDHFHIDAKGLVATLGVGSLAVAFAAQDTIANMISGFVIMFDRPFRVGDRIRTPSDIYGEVYEIGLRSMKILDFEKNLHIIPNQEIIKSVVVNYSYPNPEVRVKVTVGVAYGSDLDRVKKIIIDIYKAHPDILETPEPSAYFIEFGDSSLNILGVGYVSHYNVSWRVSEEIRMNVYKALNEHHIEIPFPQRDVWLHQAES